MKNNILFFILLMSIISCNKEENCYDSLDNHVNEDLNSFLKKEWKLSKITVESFNYIDFQVFKTKDDSILPKDLMPNFSFKGFNEHDLQFFLDDNLYKSFKVVSEFELPKPAAFAPINEIGYFDIKSFDCSLNELEAGGIIYNDYDSISTQNIPHLKIDTINEIVYQYIFHYESDN